LLLLSPVGLALWRGGMCGSRLRFLMLKRAAAGRSRASRHMIQNLRCEGCLERGGGRRSDSSQPSPIRDKGTCRGPRPGCAVALAAVRIVSTVSFVLAMSIRPRAPHGRVGSRRPATRHSTPHTGHGGPSPSAVRPGGVASFALRGLPVPPSLAFAVYTLGIRIHYRAVWGLIGLIFFVVALYRATGRTITVGTRNRAFVAG
jgi:hypothetical protein